MSPRPSFASVDDYLASLAPEQAKILRSVHATIRKSVPAAMPVISYGIPAFKKERVFIYCAAFKRHIGIYPPLRSDAKLRAALKPYANTKGILTFPFDEAMPTRLIARLAKALEKQCDPGVQSKLKSKGRKKRENAP